MAENEYMSREEFLKNKWMIGMILVLLLFHFALLYSVGTGGPAQTENATGENPTYPKETTTTTTIPLKPEPKPTTSTNAVLSGASSEYCPGMSGFLATECLVRVALSEKNMDICRNMTEKKDRAFCISTYANKVDPNACNLFREYPGEAAYLVECTSWVALTRSDPARCDKLPSKSPSHLSSLCRLDYFFNDKERKTADCDRIPDNTMRSYCLAVTGGDKKSCERLKFGEWGGGWLYERCVNCIEKGYAECGLSLAENGTITAKT